MCQQNSLSIQQSACLPEQEKVRRLDLAKEHLKLAETEREYYNSQIKAACSSKKAAAESQMMKPRIAHYIYDFSQQIHFPFSAQQTGPEYF